MFSIIQSRPAGQFGDNIGLGDGGNAAYLFGLDRMGILSLRADVGFIDYGSESKHVPLSPTIGGRIEVKVSINNVIVPVSIGPQLTWPRGSVRPYVHAGFGGQFFFTESSVDGADGAFTDLSTTNQHDRTKSWVDSDSDQPAGERHAHDGRAGGRAGGQGTGSGTHRSHASSGFPKCP